MDSCTDRAGHELKPDPAPLLVTHTKHALSLVAGSPADVLLIGRLAAVLTGGDASVRLTQILELYDAFAKAPAARVGALDADAQEGGAE